LYFVGDGLNGRYRCGIWIGAGCQTKGITRYGCPRQPLPLIAATNQAHAKLMRIVHVLHPLRVQLRHQADLVSYHRMIQNLVPFCYRHFGRELTTGNAPSKKMMRSL
jgi:hypothetical protein